MRNFSLFYFILITTTIFSSCMFGNSTTKLQVINQSRISLDSVLFSINIFHGKLEKLLPGNSDVVFNEKQKIGGSGHDVIYQLKAYSQGNEIAKEIIFSNDLGYIPDEAVFAFTDSLRFVQIK